MPAEAQSVGFMIMYKLPL